jgi:hypothetical protein
MASIRRPSRAEQAASNAWRGADGGCIFADAPNAVTSVAVILHRVSMPRNITPLRVIRSSRASSRASSGFTTIGLTNSSPARSLPLLTRIRWISPCRDRPGRCLQTGKRCFTNSGAPRFHREYFNAFADPSSARGSGSSGCRSFWIARATFPFFELHNSPLSPASCVAVRPLTALVTCVRGGMKRVCKCE